MSCQNCVKHATTAILGVPGVESAEVSLEERQAVVLPDTVDVVAIIAALDEEGYVASPLK